MSCRLPISVAIKLTLHASFFSLNHNHFVSCSKTEALSPEAAELYLWPERNSVSRADKLRPLKACACAQIRTQTQLKGAHTRQHNGINSPWCYWVKRLWPSVWLQWKDNIYFSSALLVENFVEDLLRGPEGHAVLFSLDCQSWRGPRTRVQTPGNRRMFLSVKKTPCALFDMMMNCLWNSRVSSSLVAVRWGKLWEEITLCPLMQHQSPYEILHQKKREKGKLHLEEISCCSHFFCGRHMSSDCFGAFLFLPKASSCE